MIPEKIITHDVNSAQYFVSYCTLIRTIMPGGINKCLDYLVCVREHEDHQLLHNISGVHSKEILQLVHRHESADLKGTVKAKSYVSHEDAQDNQVGVEIQFFLD